MEDAPDHNGLCVRSREEKEAIAKKFLAQPDKAIPADAAQTLQSPAFDFWKYEPDTILLLRLLQRMYEDLGAVEKFSIPIDNLRHFIATVFVDYNDNSYHNFNHCFCVSQMMFCLIKGMSIDWLTDLDRFILLTAAICHDLDHPGTNNAYQKKAHTWFVEKYPDSFLERHHFDVAGQIISEPSGDILVNLPKDQQQFFMRLMEKLILATDMAFHQQFVTQFKEVLSAGTYDPNNQENRELVMLLMLKACDISNEARPLPVTEKWVNCLLEEFFQQGDMEREKGLPVDAFMDRSKVERNSSQVGFIQFVSLPLFEELGQVVPLDTMLRNLQQNLKHYQEEKASVLATEEQKA